jgi:hypothetical protein
MFKRPCLDCGRLAYASRCEYHTSKLKAEQNAKRDADPARRARKKLLYNSTYSKKAKQVRETATVCHICKQGYIPGDPWQADHVLPGQLNSLLLPAHRSCNARRGSKPIQQ